MLAWYVPRTCRYKKDKKLHKAKNTRTKNYPLTSLTTPALTPTFLADFLSVLASNGCDNLFGIDTIAKGAWSEIKIGDASVVVPSNESDGQDQDKFIPVAFAFDEEKPKIMVHGKCKKEHAHSSKPKPK